MSSLTNVGNSIKNSISGSAPRSSEGIYKATTEKAASLFSPNKSSASRLMSAPVESIIQPTTSSPSISPSSGGSFWRYLIILAIIGALGFNFLLFLIKPADKDITHLYDPLIKFRDTYFKKAGAAAAGASAAARSAAAAASAAPSSALKKLEKTLETKPVVNNIDNKQKVNLGDRGVKNYKKLPVIPEADDATSSVQKKPTSKAGFCYIGEDRGFRNCIDVKEGDVCMSGDIFPTEAICINPNLRE
jgi:hypothetical protein